MWAKIRRVCSGGVIATSMAAFLLVSNAVVQQPASLALTVAEFQANPASLLSLSGNELASAVRELVLANPAMLDSVIALLTRATEAQQSSIGAGLGQLALAVVQTNPELATAIQTALAASGNRIAIASYSAATGNTVTAATGGGGGGGGSGVGGPIGSNNFPTGGSGSAGPTGGTGTGGTGTANSFRLTGGSGGGTTVGSSNPGGSVSP